MAKECRCPLDPPALVASYGKKKDRREAVFPRAK
jgi:hypothetical protein